MTTLVLTARNQIRRIDPVVGTLALLLAALIAWSPGLAADSVRFALEALPTSRRSCCCRSRSRPTPRRPAPTS